ncbi:MAG: hypothetical protein R3F11_15750 [Verrucomicrobiales bacterium]
MQDFHRRRCWSIWRRCDAAVAQVRTRRRVEPLVPVDLVVDHSVQADFAYAAGGASTGTWRIDQIRQPGAL